MSYNYDQSVASIAEHRHRAYSSVNHASKAATPSAVSSPDLDALQQSIDEFATLSKKCPMTPLLWMQYAKDIECLIYGLHSLDFSLSEGSDSNVTDLVHIDLIRAKKEAIESSNGILELALSEFPGCSLLHLYYLESRAEYFVQCETEGLHHRIKSENEVGVEYGRRADREKFSLAFQSAWQSTGRGSHVNEGSVVSEIYRLQGSFLLYCLSATTRQGNNSDSIMNIEADDDELYKIIENLSSLITEWSRTPMGEGSNDELIENIEWLWEEASSLVLLFYDTDHAKRAELKNFMMQEKVKLWNTIDAYRRSTSALANLLSSYENEVDVAMSNEGLSFPHSSMRQRQQDSLSNPSDTDKVDLGKYFPLLRRKDSKWDWALQGDNFRFLLGLGGGETSRAFSKYAIFLQRRYQNYVQKGTAGYTDALQNIIATRNYSMITCLYERAISECPTVETLWLSYIKFLRGEFIRIRQDAQSGNHHNEYQDLKNALISISHRSVRNCPYSSNLFELQMTTLGVISTTNLEPDDLSAVIQAATQLGFLNNNREAMLSMRFVAITVVKKKLLSLVSLGTTHSSGNGSSNEVLLNGKDYDEDEDMIIDANIREPDPKFIDLKYRSMDPTIKEEVQDLIEDIRDMYEETNSFLFQSYPAWIEGKLSYWKHRALTEAYIICPISLGLRKALRRDAVTNEFADKESIECFEKLVKVQKPCHPDSWRNYIRYVSMSRLFFFVNLSTFLPDEVGAVTAVLRQTRALYKRALSSIRKAGRSTDVAGGAQGFVIGEQYALRLYDSALYDLCHEYLEFERNYGSEETLTEALSLVQNKMSDYNRAPETIFVAPAPATKETGKRKLEPAESASSVNLNDTCNEEDWAENDDDDGQTRSKKTKVKTNLKEPKMAVHRVRLGNIDYPAHPFTVHVSNLDKNVQDLDLVDAFRPICGPIVHAKILREKQYGKAGHHFTGESKGSGLIQFEDRMSVEIALEKNGELQIGGKFVRIKRSHMPAVGLVPQGMHRVNPKGEGKSSKRNTLKKNTTHVGDGDANMETNDDEDKVKRTEIAEKRNSAESIKDTPMSSTNKYRSSSSPGSLKLDVLSLKPRGLKQKQKISLSGSANKDNE